MNNIRFLRERNGLSQANVAYAVGVTPQAVSKWERGESDPQWEQAPKLAAVFGCQIDDLYSREPPSPIGDLFADTEAASATS